MLATAACLELLRTKRIGRLGLSMGALPVVHPVNFAVGGDRIVIRTGIGSKLSAALRGAVVCLEVDDIDDDGTADALGERSSWVGDHYVGIRVELVSGRRGDDVSRVARPSARSFPALT